MRTNPCLTRRSFPDRSGFPVRKYKRSFVAKSHCFFLLMRIKAHCFGARLPPPQSPAHRAAPTALATHSLFLNAASCCRRIPSPQRVPAPYSASAHLQTQGALAAGRHMRKTSRENIPVCHKNKEENSPPAQSRQIGSAAPLPAQRPALSERLLLFSSLFGTAFADGRHPFSSHECRLPFAHHPAPIRWPDRLQSHRTALRSADSPDESFEWNQSHHPKARCGRAFPGSAKKHPKCRRERKTVPAPGPDSCRCTPCRPGAFAYPPAKGCPPHAKKEKTPAKSPAAAASPSRHQRL